MRERGIIFGGPMVRAILDGRKSVTRRVMKPQPNMPEGYADACPTAASELLLKSLRCPYGAPGDRLWCREGWGVWPATLDSERRVLYRATCPDYPEGWPFYRGPIWDMVRWRPSIHMPRWASRITLEVTGISAKRVQGISNADARAEGIPQMYPEALELFPDLCKAPGHEWDNRTSAENFALLWDSINAKRGFGWSANPWVWAISFKVVAR